MGKTRDTGKLATQIQFDNNNNLIIGSSPSSVLDISGSIEAVSITGSFSGSVFAIGDTAAFSSSVNTRISTIEGVNTFTSSASARLNAIETTSASNISRLNALEDKSASVDTTNTTQNNRLTSLENKSGSLATTGSNTFVGTQIITGSLYVTTDLIVQGSSSIQNITGSSVNIGTNTVVLNTANPAVRYAGISAIDSGSTGLTGSILWDSTNNNWIYVNPSGSSYASAKFIAGPKSSTLGSELGLITNYIQKAVGDDHISSSAILDDGTTIKLLSNTEVTSSLKVSGSLSVGTSDITGSITIQSKVLNTSGSVLNIKTSYTNKNSIIELAELSSDGAIILRHALATSPTIMLTSQTGGTSPNYFNNGSNVGIGTTNPAYPLEIVHGSGYGLRLITNDVTASNNSGILFYNEASSTVGTRRSYVLLDPNGGNGTGGDYSFFDMFGSGTATLMNQLAYGTLALGVGGTSRLYITGSNIGIGTAAPSDKLDVYGTLRASVNTSYFTSFGYSGGTLVRMVSPSAEVSDNMVFKIEGASSSTTGNQFIFQTQAGNTTPVTTLWINKLGDVSIGTTTSAKYQVLNLINDANTAGAAIGLARTAGQFITNGGAGDLVIGNATGKNILFGNTGAGTTEYMRITSGGSVGIGSSSPAAKLDVRGSGDGDLIIGRYSGGQAKLFYAYQSGADGYLELRTGADSTISRISGYSGTSSYFLSSVGIGITNPSTVLEVNGSVSHTNGSTFKSIEFFRSINANTSATNLYTVTIGASNRAVFYEIIIFGGDWSNHSAARTVKRGFFCPNAGYTAHNVIESSGLYAANITLGYSQSGTAFTTTLTLDSGTTSLDCHIRLVGDVSSYS